MASFADLLHRADKLSSAVKTTKQDASSSGKGWTSFAAADTTFDKGDQPFASSARSKASSVDAMNGVEPNLDQILKRGETLWRKTTASAGDKSLSTNTADLHA